MRVNEDTEQKAPAPVLVTVKSRDHYLNLFKDDAEGHQPSFSLGEGLQITTELLVDIRDFTFQVMNVLNDMQLRMQDIHKIALAWYQTQQQRPERLPFDINKLRSK
jgi:hypothetical protein